MVGEEKNMPAEGSASRAVADLIDAGPGVTVNALGYEELPGGGVVWSLEVIFADGREAAVSIG